MPDIDGETLRAWRRSQGWDVPEMARRIRRAAGDDPVPVHDALVRMIRRWERLGLKTERYELLYRSALGIAVGADEPGPPAAEGHAAGKTTEGYVLRHRFDGVSAGQLDEIVGHLDDQWHALVKTDNLFGPLHALSGVRGHLGVIGALLRNVRLPYGPRLIRARALQRSRPRRRSAGRPGRDSGDLMATPAETAAMRRAIALAAAGLGTTSPNPPVGCVILAGGVVAGEGYHERKGEAHAEVQALTAAGHLAVGATAVVTLEPCNHHGRTPPCRQALIDAGIGRVVVALADPTSRGDGGTTMLRAAGVDVETGVLAGEARIVMSAWLAALRTRRPFITWPYQLADQGIAPLPDGTAEGRRLRLNADAVLMHDGTVGEAVPGTHGAGILSLKDAAPGEDPHAVAAALYDGGVRHLMLHGGIETAGPFLAADLVDSVLAYMPGGSGSRRPRQNLPWPLLPPGFTITDVDRIDGYVRATARRHGLR